MIQLLLITKCANAYIILTTRNTTTTHMNIFKLVKQFPQLY